MTLLTQRVDQHAQRTIEYLKEENRILLHRLGRKRLILTDQERRILAVIVCVERLGGLLKSYHRRAA